MNSTQKKRPNKTDLVELLQHQDLLDAETAAQINCDVEKYMENKLAEKENQLQDLKIKNIVLLAGVTIL